MTAPDPQGRGALLAMQRALSDANVAAEAIDFVSSHGRERRLMTRWKRGRQVAVWRSYSSRVPVNSIKGSVGHTLRSGGVLEAVMATHVLRRQQIPATTGLEQPDPSFELDLVMGAPGHAVRYVLSTTSGFRW